MGKTIYICKICKEKYSTIEGLYAHLEKEHADAIPEDMCVEQFYYFLKTGKEHGKCVECGNPTLWNDKTKKYKRFCEDPACMEKYKETVRQRMIGKYGKVNLLNDPEQQRKMLMNRSISGAYNFNGVSIPYVGSYELDFLKTMDIFLDWDANDIIMPSPHTYYYMYEGEKKFYIPDVFIPSLGLEIEIKDGGNNPNMHHKIQDVDKEKEKLKDEVMSTQKIFHYIKITNKNYYNLFDFFDKMKEGLEKYEDYDKIPKIIITEDIKTKQVNPKSKNLLKKEANEVLKENVEIVEEGFFLSKEDDYINFDKFESGESNICLITGLSGSGKSTLGKYLAEKYNAIYVELDAFYLMGDGIESIDPIFDNYLKKYKKIYSQLENDEFFDNGEISVKILKNIINYCKSIKNKKFIIEGVQLFLYDNKDITKYPIIIKNTSALKSLKRMMTRDVDLIINSGSKARNINIFKSIPRFLKYYIEDERNLKKFKKNNNVNESYNHYITLNINNNMNKGLYGFRDGVSSISLDNNHIKRVNHKMQLINESYIDKENTTEIKFGYNGDIKPVFNNKSNQGSFLLWNKNDSIKSLLESISKEWFDSKLSIDDIHRIGGDD